MTTDRAMCCEVKLDGYEPPVGHRPSFYDMGLPCFTAQHVGLMLRDPKVKLGVALKSAPLLKPKFTVKATRPDVAAFVQETLEDFWSGAMPDVLSGLWYIRSGGELVYRKVGDLVKFSKFVPVYPEDMTILVRGSRRVGMKVKMKGRQDVVLNGHESFLYINNREFSSWDGTSELEGAYDPWIEKTQRGGAKEIRKLWFYKNSFTSGQLFVPPGGFTDAAGNEVKWLDVGRQAMESFKAGGSWVFEMVYDEQGRPLFELKPATTGGDAASILQYPKELDAEILQGIGIPDDILTQNSGVGGYAGRTIPLMAFFVSQEVKLRRIVSDVKEQVLDYLTWLNFETNDYSVQAEVDADALMPAGPSQGPQVPVPVLAAPATEGGAA